MRSWKRLDVVRFKLLISQSAISDSCKFEIAPMHTVVSKYFPLATWCDSECRKFKRHCRKLERKYKKAWGEALNAKNKLCSDKRC